MVRGPRSVGAGLRRVALAETLVADSATSAVSLVRGDTGRRTVDGVSGLPASVRAPAQMRRATASDGAAGGRSRLGTLMPVAPSGMTLEELRSRRDEIVATAHRRRARHVRVFGSVSRGTAGPSSDLDLLVDFDPDASLLDQVGLIQDLEALLGVPVDVVSSGGLRPRHGQIREEAVEL